MYDEDGHRMHNIERIVHGKIYPWCGEGIDR